jgi:hypothetical protein
MDAGMPETDSLSSNKCSDSHMCVHVCIHRSRCLVCVLENATANKEIGQCQRVGARLYAGRRAPRLYLVTLL